MQLKKIISGGQTGVDRAALDAAIACNFEYGGWIPKGRLAEDGPIPFSYVLNETPLADSRQRTEWNVRDSDATLIISTLPLTGGTKFTETCAEKHNKPILQIDHKSVFAHSINTKIIDWLIKNDVTILNIAGPRESEDIGIYQYSLKFIFYLLKQLGNTVK